MSETNNSVTGTIILEQLKAQVTEVNAKILFESARVSAGVELDMESPLNADDSLALITQLINNGGPSFKVGQELYKTYIQ